MLVHSQSVIHSQSFTVGLAGVGKWKHAGGRRHQSSYEDGCLLLVPTPILETKFGDSREIMWKSDVSTAAAAAATGRCVGSSGEERGAREALAQAQQEEVGE